MLNVLILYFNSPKCSSMSLTMTQVWHTFCFDAHSKMKRLAKLFFWHLKAEMHCLDISERYAILLEAYLRGCGRKRQELKKQNEVLNQLVGVANTLKDTRPAERIKVLREGISKINFPKSFQMPLDQRWEASKVIIPKCKYMDSKKLPLWLVFENVEQVGISKPLTVIFKVGDDLRQDALTLQMIRLMDRLWKQQNLDLRLKPYGCVATGDEIGMIEVVLNSDTTANINARAGGAKALLNKDTLANWLKDIHPSKEQYAKAQENFKLSAAGYCVATYVLGIGDRHNDNIMMTREGHLFHIDFGHFLGNYKKKFHVKRERAPFVFTPQYAAILGGKKSAVFKDFLQVCGTAYNIVRKHADTFINLFQLMLCGGIPELRELSDINHLREALQLGLADEAAAKHFGKLVDASLRTKFTTIDHMIHVWVHN
mmetsp:Transcript_5538/g.8474  ORF Transcript_5538/g.8474 Transcript_5538/m.8474 type:complete len:427 (-) Transcript_5538:26-1306(-)